MPKKNMVRPRKEVNIDLTIESSSFLLDGKFRPNGERIVLSREVFEFLLPLPRIPTKLLYIRVVPRVFSGIAFFLPNGTMQSQF